MKQCDSRSCLTCCTSRSYRSTVLCQQPFITHDTTSQETSREGVLQHCVKTHKPREQDREERAASRFFLAVCAADGRVVTVLCAMFCQQPFIPHDTTSQETSREGVLQHCVKTHKPREQDREERNVLCKTNGRAHARPLKVAGTSSV